jgi:hypothetical protein
MHRIGRFVFKGQMRPFLVIDQHRLGYHFLRVCQVLWAMQQELHFQNPIHSLDQSILITVITVSY